MSGTVREIAYAKINLALHVRRRREDGYHDIETVFAFCEDGDVVEAELADRLSLTVDGPFAADVPPGGNLVLGAAAELDVAAAIRLTKRLPIASGIGGGSADAAATLRLLSRMADVPMPPAKALLALGADVPACVRSETLRGDGAGELLTPAAAVSGIPILLVNPRVPVATEDVFKGWDGIDHGPLTDWRAGRNDLEAPARALAPMIGDVLAWLVDRPGLTLARMSGSGATCFSLFDGAEARDRAAAEVPYGWWSMASRLR